MKIRKIRNRTKIVFPRSHLKMGSRSPQSVAKQLRNLYHQNVDKACQHRAYATRDGIIINLARPKCPLYQNVAQARLYDQPGHIIDHLLFTGRNKCHASVIVLMPACGTRTLACAYSSRHGHVRESALFYPENAPRASYQR